MWFRDVSKASLGDRDAKCETDRQKLVERFQVGGGVVVNLLQLLEY